MVVVAAPPPTRSPRPLLHSLAAGTSLRRIFHPMRHGASAEPFRYYGPLLRFDHHRGAGRPDRPGEDPERGIYYAARTLSGCVVEVFGDIGVIECADWQVAIVDVARDLPLLDLRGRGAMRAGTVAALAKHPHRPLTQAWARHFYEHEEIYTAIDGLLFFNARNDEDAVALFERSQGALRVAQANVRRLDDPRLRPALLAIADRHNLVLA